MIKSFACKETERIWNRQFSKKLPADIQGGSAKPIARRKLIMIDTASTIDDLAIPPANQLKLYCGKGKKDKFSIRINDQWRICFYFKDGNAFEVEIVDYH